MFKNISGKIFDVLSSFVSRSRVSEQDINDTVREIRIALLDADVNFSVVKSFVSKVKNKVLEQNLSNKSTIANDFIKIVHSEILDMLSFQSVEFMLSGRPHVIMLCGLQGSGKTTTAAKLGLFYKNLLKNKKVLLVACDFKRAAAVEQLVSLGKSIDIEVFVHENQSLPSEKIAADVMLYAQKHLFDLIIIDTFGRMHVDEELMLDLNVMHRVFKPNDVFLVANAALGQESVKIAKSFNERLNITGIILTMMDGDAKAGCALSMKSVIDKPILFEGTGEHCNDLVEFVPESMASRILGLGDLAGFDKMSKLVISQKKQEEIEAKIIKKDFSFSDYLDQMQAFQKMGPLRKLFQMLPGSSNISDEVVSDAEKNFSRTKSIILSMTKDERDGLVPLDLLRMKRIAKGSGTSVADINKLRKSIQNMSQQFKNFKKKKTGNFTGGF